MSKKRYAPLVKGFHWRDGWYFTREQDGSVHVRKRDRWLGKEYATEARTMMVIPPSEWASIVASVSFLGETGPRWLEALNFHQNGSAG